MFKSIAIATLALLMTVDMTGLEGKDLHQLHQEVQQRIAGESMDDTCTTDNSTPEEIALDDDTIELETHPEDFMLDEDTSSYRWNIKQHLIDAKQILDKASPYLKDPVLSDVEHYDDCMYGYTRSSCGLTCEFILWYDDYGPDVLVVNTGYLVKRYRVDENKNVTFERGAIW